MNTAIIIALCYAIKYSNAVVIAPDSNDPFITVDLTTDPRSINKINAANQWKLFQKWSNPLLDWGITLTLDAEEYSFRDRDGSSIIIEMDGFCSTDQCDAYFAFSIGDQGYMTFVTDFDGGFDVNLADEGDARTGIFAYPGCGSNGITSGDPSILITSITDFSRTTLRDALSGGEDERFDQLSSIQNGENFPIRFELINNYNSNTFTFKFSSPTFLTPLECTYNSAVPTGQDFKLYITPDGGSEILKIKTFTIDGINTGFTPQPTVSPTLDGCDFDIDAYLEKCYCSNNVETGIAAKSVFGFNKNQNQYRNNYQGYDRINIHDNENNGFNDGGNGNNNLIQYLNLLLNFVILSYIFYVNSRWCGVKRNQNKFQKVSIYSDAEQSERNAINA